jgi:hypothetical protein
MRDVIDGMFGEGTTAQVVDWIKKTFGPLVAEFERLDAKAMWQSFADGADNAGFAVQRLIDKLIDLAGWISPIEAATRLLRKAGVLGQGDATERAMGRGMNAPVAESITDELALRMAEQQRNIEQGLAARNARRAEQEREAKYGPREFNMEAMANRGPYVPYASGPAVYAPMPPPPAAAGGGAGAPAVNLAAPTIIINGNDTATVKRVVTEAMEAERKKTAAALGGRGRS